MIETYRGSFSQEKQQNKYIHLYFHGIDSK